MCTKMSNERTTIENTRENRHRDNQVCGQHTLMYCKESKREIAAMFFLPRRIQIMVCCTSLLGSSSHLIWRGSVCFCFCFCFSLSSVFFCCLLCLLVPPMPLLLLLLFWLILAVFNRVQHKPFHVCNHAALI